MVYASEAKKILDDRIDLHNLVDSQGTEQLKSTRVVWANHGAEVFLTGSFDDWTNKVWFAPSNFPFLVENILLVIHMLKIKRERSSAGVFVAKLHLKLFLVFVVPLFQLFSWPQIKFIVDGVWKVDPHRAIAYSGTIENNLLMVF